MVCDALFVMLLLVVVVCMLHDVVLLVVGLFVCCMMLLYVMLLLLTGLYAVCWSEMCRTGELTLVIRSMIAVGKYYSIRNSL